MRKDIHSLFFFFYLVIVNIVIRNINEVKMSVLPGLANSLHNSHPSNVLLSSPKLEI